MCFNNIHRESVVVYVITSNLTDHDHLSLENFTSELQSRQSIVKTDVIVVLLYISNKPVMNCILITTRVIVKKYLFFQNTSMHKYVYYLLVRIKNKFPWDTHKVFYG